jgi:precorrin-6Y C5,15-methyltransferase (decarboxylating)
MLHVIGTTAAGLSGLASAQRHLLDGAAVIAAPSRLHHELPASALLLNTDQPQAAIEALALEMAAGCSAVLLASGDPLWFGIGRLLLQHFSAEQLRFHPCPCSMQLAFSRLGRPWQNAQWLSLHGREPDALAARLQQWPEALAVLTDPGRGGAGEVRQILRASGLEAAYGFWICERLDHPEERVMELACSDPLPEDLDPLHLVVLIAKAEPLEAERLPLFGISDGAYHQHADHPGLMTKREVRIQLLAELDLPSAGVLWDLGAGTGSVGLEALRLQPKLQLFAVERRSGAVPLIEANAERLAVQPAAVLQGDATSLLAELPDPDRVLLGGGGAARAELLAALLPRLRAGGVVVIPLATLEAVAELRPVLEAHGLQVSLMQLQVSRGMPLAGGTRLAPLNPVVVLRGCRA